MTQETNNDDDLVLDVNELEEDKEERYPEESEECIATEGEKGEKKKEKLPPMDLDIKKGAFHRWLGKKEGEPITMADIQRGLKSSDPHVRRMAQFAKNSKKWKHKKKEKPAAAKRQKTAVEEWSESK
jgi:hypothetical protein